MNIRLCDAASICGLLSVFVVPSSATAQLRREQILKCTPVGLTENDARVGADIAVSDELLIAGAPGLGMSRGAVFVFDRRTGTQVGRIGASDGNANELFGETVAIRDGRIAVGAPLHAIPSSGTGAVYLFDAVSLTLVRKLSPVRTSGQFGSAVALAEDGEVLVGAALDDSGGNGRGAAYCIDAATGEVRGVLVGDPTVRRFGASVAVSTND